MECGFFLQASRSSAELCSSLPSGKKQKQNPPSSGCSTRTFPGERVGKTLEMLRQVAQRAARQVFAVIHPRTQRPTLAYV